MFDPKSSASNRLQMSYKTALQRQPAAPGGCFTLSCPRTSKSRCRESGEFTSLAPYRKEQWCVKTFTKERVEKPYYCGGLHLIDWLIDYIILPWSLTLVADYASYVIYLILSTNYIILNKWDYISYRYDSRLVILNPWKGVYSISLGPSRLDRILLFDRLF